MTKRDSEPIAAAGAGAEEASKVWRMKRLASAAAIFTGQAAAEGASGVAAQTARIKADISHRPASWSACGVREAYAIIMRSDARLSSTRL